MKSKIMQAKTDFNVTQKQLVYRVGWRQTNNSIEA